jgi:hypothetical protein
MAETKYGKYVVRNPVKIDKFGPEIRFSGEEHYGSDFSLLFFHISKPVLMEDSPHNHDFDMYLYFLGVNGLDDFSAEIDIGFGLEREIHTITTPASVYVPKGLIHCPLHFKRVDKPILFVHAVIAAKYAKKEIFR